MQVDTQFELSSAELRKVERVRFGIFSPEEIKAMSVCEVKTPFTYDNGIPKDDGLLDLRMGTMERNIRCKSCAGDMRSCPGHFGHIELVKPCLHSQDKHETSTEIRGTLKQLKSPRSIRFLLGAFFVFVLRPFSRFNANHCEDP